MTDEEKVTNGRNSRGSHQLPNDSAASHVDVPEINESVIKTAEEKLQDVTGNLLHSPEIEPSIYQTDIVTQSTKPTAAPPTSASTKPAAEGSTTKVTPTTKPEKGASPTPTQKGVTESPSPSPTGTGPTAEPEERAELTETATTDEPGDTEATTEPGEGDVDGSTTPEGTPTETPTPTGDAVTQEGDVKSEEDAKSDSEAGVSTTTGATTEPPPKDPYQIDIPIEKKINKRTKRKLWEEIEKRKPLIPKYVERHIQKYAKPPFELWGCKNGGKGSCYGCG